MHVEQWNQLNCSNPAVSTSKVELDNLPNGQEYLSRTSKKLEEVIAHLKSPAASELLQTELYLVAKLYYKGAYIYQRFKIRSTLRQLRNCLTRLIDLNMCKSFEEYLHIWPRTSFGEKYVYLPRKEMLQFLLVRLMGGARLMMQTCAYCHHGFEEVMLNLRLGMLAPQMLVIGACFSRVWALCHSLRKRFEDWYDALKEVGQYLPEAEADWLQTEIPDKLSAWLPPDPDLPSDGVLNLQKAAEKSKTAFIDWEEDEGLAESETLQADEESVSRISVQEVNGDDLGSPVSRTAAKMIPASEDITILQDGAGDDLGSPISRTKIRELPDFQMDMDETQDLNNSSTKKIKKKRKEKLTKKMLSRVQEHDVEFQPPENYDGNPNQPADSQELPGAPMVENKLQKKKNTKKLKDQPLDTVMTLDKSEVNFQETDSIKLSKFTQKKLKKLGLSEKDKTIGSTNDILSKKSKKKLKKLL